MKLYRTMLFASLFATGCALADGTGSFTVHGKEFSLKSAYAYTHSDPFDSTKQATVIAFCARAFDEKQIASADDPAAALSDALNAYVSSKEKRPAKVEIIVARGKASEPILDVSYSIPGESSQANSRAASYIIEFKRNDDKRIEGTLRSKLDADKNARFGGYFDLDFALDVHPDAGG